jgi:integration host factor subunit beta
MSGANALPPVGAAATPPAMPSKHLGDAMNKSELIKALAEKKKLHIEESTKIVTAFVDAVKEALVRGDRVEIRGFGSFKIKAYSGYIGRNPKTGAVVKVQPKKLPFFRPGKELKEYING